MIDGLFIYLDVLKVYDKDMDIFSLKSFKILQSACKNIGHDHVRSIHKPNI